MSALSEVDIGDYETCPDRGTFPKCAYIFGINMLSLTFLFSSLDVTNLLNVRRAASAPAGRDYVKSSSSTIPRTCSGILFGLSTKQGRRSKLTCESHQHLRSYPLVSGVRRRRFSSRIKEEGPYGNDVCWSQNQ